jgi:DNA-binding response OmpR family regulator
MTKIMLVEDDNNLREIYEARLAAEGYEIVAAQDGEAALALAGKEKPDLIISDVMMPKISGFEMLDILRNTDTLRNVKIIMLTALGQAEDSERANHLGADRYLVKSQVTLEDIVNTAHELLEGTAPAPAATANPGPDADSVAEAIEMPAAPVEEAAAQAVVAPEAEVPAAPVALEPVQPVVTEPAAPEVPVASEPVAAPVAPVAEPGSFAVVEPPADEPVAPSADVQPVVPPAPVSEPAAPEIPPAPIDVVIPAPADESGPQLPAPVADTPETPEFAAPAVPAGGGPVISIPVLDDAAAIPDDSTASATDVIPTEEPAAPAADQELHPISGLPVVPETPAADFTSPENFNTFQPTQTPDGAQSNAEETASIQNQIDAFIQQDAEAPAAEPIPVADAAPSAEPAVIPEPPVVEEPLVIEEQPVVEEPVLAEPPVEDTPAAVPEPSAVFSPTLPPAPASDEIATEAPAPAAEPVVEAPDAGPAGSGPIFAMPTSAPAPELEEPAVLDTAPSVDSTAAPVASTDQQVQGDFSEPVPDELTSFEAPVITGPPSAGTAETDDDAQLEAAVHNLEDNTAPEPADDVQSAPQQANNKKVISPIAPPDDQKNIHQLLELEQAKTGAQQAAVVTSEPKPNVDAYNPAVQPSPAPTDDQASDPNSISL